MKLVIDAGHGGRDPGGMFRGAKEKTIVLDIAHQLERMLERSSVDTEMTRHGDTTLRLRERTDYANASGADLFLSIHTNADPDEDGPADPEAQGKEVWVNPGSEKGTHFAQGVQEGFKREFPDEPFRGIKERGLWVLRKTAMPAILAEVAFIDNSDSHRELLSSEVRGHLAFALMRGVLWYERLHH